MKKLLSALGLVVALPLAVAVRSAAFVALATALLGGCASSPPTGVPASVTVVPDSRGVQRVNVIAGNYYFQPSHIIVRAGLPVELTIERHSLIPHTFTIAAPTAGIAVDVKLPREPTTASFTPKAPGSYRFICTEDTPFLASHLERGMQGTLEVLP